MRNLLSRHWLVLATFAFSSPIGSIAHGTDIALQNPSTGETLGYQGNYNAYGYNLDYHATYAWAVQQTDSSTPTGWIACNSTSVDLSGQWTIPGTFVLRLTVTYGGNSGGPGPIPDVVTRTVTISPPSVGSPINLEVPVNYTVNIASPTNISNCQGYYVFFPIMAGSVSAGPYLAGAFQEQITNLYVFGDKQPDQDIDPFPPTNNNLLFYFCPATNGNQYIYDWKQVSTSAIAVGCLNSYTQLFFLHMDRLLWQHPNSTSRIGESQHTRNSKSLWWKYNMAAYSELKVGKK